MTLNYDEELEVVRSATEVFTKVQNDYRSRKIGDEEYLAARKVYNEAQARFDAVCAKCTE